MIISAHFSVDEVLTTNQQGFTGLQKSHLLSNAEIVHNVYRLADEVLEPWRAKLGVPIRITSWLRSPDLNAAVGGSATSQHISGEAADAVPRGDLMEAFRALKGLPFGQRILYLNADGSPRHIHVSVKGKRVISEINRSLLAAHGKFRPYTGA